MSVIDKAWRCLGTGLFLAVIGSGGSLLAITIFPLITLCTRDRAKRQRHIQRVIHLSLGIYCRLIDLMRIADVEFVGTERLHGIKGKLIVANHPTLLDVVMIMAAVPNVQCIVKKALFHHPFFRLTVGGAGYISNGLDPETLLAACVATVRDGNNLIIFPEGTRSVAGRPMRMRRGFANIALAAEADLQVLTITCDPPVLHKGNPWWRVPQRRPHFRMEVGNLLSIHEYVSWRRGWAARRIATTLERFYTERLGYGQPGS